MAAGISRNSTIIVAGILNLIHHSTQGYDRGHSLGWVRHKDNWLGLGTTMRWLGLVKTLWFGLKEALPKGYRTIIIMDALTNTLLISLNHHG